MVVVSCDNNASAQIYTPVESENIDNCNPNAKPTTGGECVATAAPKKMMK